MELQRQRIVLVQPAHAAASLGPSKAHQQFPRLPCALLADFATAAVQPRRRRQWLCQPGQPRGHNYHNCHNHHNHLPYGARRRWFPKPPRREPWGWCGQRGGGGLSYHVGGGAERVQLSVYRRLRRGTGGCGGCAQLVRRAQEADCESPRGGGCRASAVGTGTCGGISGKGGRKGAQESSRATQLGARGATMPLLLKRLEQATPFAQGSHTCRVSSACSAPGQLGHSAGPLRLIASKHGR